MLGVLNRISGTEIGIAMINLVIIVAVGRAFIYYLDPIFMLKSCVLLCYFELLTCAFINFSYKMDLTDEQVLAQLKVRRVKLKMELDRVEVAIKAFENIGEINILDAMPYMMEDLEVDEDLLISTLMYNPKMTAEKKVIFTLSKIGKGDASDITEYILRIDGHIKDTKRAFERITYVCSRMFKSGKITAERVGKRMCIC
ncbi:hypothetical protein J3L21_11890 [Mucilaginibacter rubeus]|uniref:Uncharacterized protein n=1 Tax=Mucilaginibacter rubeus TaxID=2027860 RepID=A0ABX7UII7_9SPHI|nr:hypothetical protein [Mucilaginibacter rubeus]QTE46019.1 hypothetical protein J3L19_11920 [Mucilaginibacter rubeus]QTE52616.1 hypothetical protein J3L21_11890 [Mucilaginibacter rubeus]